MLNQFKRFHAVMAAISPDMKRETHKLISFFSGGGVLDLGLEAAGFETVFATDIDYHSCQTLQQGKDYCAAKKLPFLQSANIRQADIVHLSSKDVMLAADVS